MNRKTLNQIGSEAKESYQDHKMRTRELAHEILWLQNRTSADWRNYAIAPLREADIEAVTSKINKDFEAHLNADNGRTFANENAAQLHDLAVIEAHLGGVAINVQLPLSIGEQIEVHKL